MDDNSHTHHLNVMVIKVSLLCTLFQVCQSQDWKDMLSYVETVKPDLLLGQDGYRRAYYLTAEYLKVM